MQLAKLKTMLGVRQDDDAQDDDLALLLEDAESDLLTWTNRKELPPSLFSTQREVAVLRYNKRGVEGQTGHSEGGISRSYEDLPESLRATIAAKRLVKMVHYP